MIGQVDGGRRALLAAAGLGALAFGGPRGITGALLGAEGSGDRPLLSRVLGAETAKHVDAGNVAAFEAALAALLPDVRRLEAGVRPVTGDNGLVWATSNAGLAGQGMTRTIVRQTSRTTRFGAAMSLGACENVLFQDIGFVGQDAFGTLTALNNNLRCIIFNRCMFTADAVASATSTNGVRIVADTASEGVRLILFVDCVFADNPRMGCEMQNNGVGTTVRMADIQFIRPRVLRNGAINGARAMNEGMGLSFTGYAQRITLTAPHFDGNAQCQLENCGASRLSVTDMTMRADTLPAGREAVSMSNAKRMLDCSIDGWRLVDARGRAATGAPLTMPAGSAFMNMVGFRLKNIDLALASAAAPRELLTFTNGCEAVSIDASRFRSDSDKTMVNWVYGVGRNVVRRSRFASSHPTARYQVAMFGSGRLAVDGCAFENRTGGTALPVQVSGTGVFVADAGNRVNGRA